MKTSLFISLAALIAAAVPASAATQDTQASTANERVLNVPKSNLAPPFSGNIGEVVKLADSGVDESVLLAFVQNSPVPFNPSADEIIKLRNAGISSPVLTAMLRRGGELRQQTASAAAASVYMPQSTGSAPQPIQPATDYSAQAQSPSSVVYVGSSYPTSSYYPTYYPYSYSYGYYYPYYSSCYPRYYSSYCYPYYSSCYSRYSSCYSWGNNCSSRSGWSGVHHTQPSNVGFNAGRVNSLHSTSGARFAGNVRGSGFSGVGGFSGGARVGGSVGRVGSSMGSVRSGGSMHRVASAGFSGRMGGSMGGGGMRHR